MVTRLVNPDRTEHTEIIEHRALREVASKEIIVLGMMMEASDSAWSGSEPIERGSY